MICPQIHVQASAFAPLSDPNATWGFDLWGNAAEMSKNKNKAGSRRLAKKVQEQGRIAETGKGRGCWTHTQGAGGSPNKVGQSDSVPRVRRICTICRRQSRLDSREELPLRGARFFLSPSESNTQNCEREHELGKTRTKGDARESGSPIRY